MTVDSATSSERMRSESVTLISGIKMALASIREAKLRAFLTVLGVVIGTGTIIGVGSIITGLDGAITEAIKAFGPDNMIVLSRGRPVAAVFRFSADGTEEMSE